MDQHHVVRRQAVGDLTDHLLVEHELVTGLAWIVPHDDVLRVSVGIAVAVLHPVEPSPPV